MYKETITYTDYDGKERTEEYLFNLTTAELVEMEMGTEGTFTGILDRIVKAKDTPDIIREIKNLLLRSYGVKSPDGRYFIKTPEDTKRFECSEPFSVMFMKLATDDEAAFAFIKGIMPKDVAKLLDEKMNAPQIASIANSQSIADVPQAQPVNLTAADLIQ